MAEYFSLIPYFLAFVTFGVVVNYIFSAGTKRLTMKRAAREIIGAIWVSAAIYAISEQFFDYSLLFMLILCSIGGFANSKIINFLQKDLIEFLFLKLKEWISHWAGGKKQCDHDHGDEEKPLV